MKVWKDAIELLDFIEKHGIQLSTVIKVASPIDKKSGTRLINGGATADDVKIVRKLVDSYLELIGFNKGDAEVSHKRVKRQHFYNLERKLNDPKK